MSRTTPNQSAEDTDIIERIVDMVDKLRHRRGQAHAMRYYLHQIQTNEVVPDPEGSMYSDLASAEREAVDAAREMMANSVRVGRDISDWTIEIADEHGNSVSRVPFASVVTRDPKRVG